MNEQKVSYLARTPLQMNLLNSEEFLQGFFKSRRILTAEMPCPETREINLLPNKLLIKYCFQANYKNQPLPFTKVVESRDHSSPGCRTRVRPTSVECAALRVDPVQDKPLWFVFPLN